MICFHEFLHLGQPCHQLQHLLTGCSSPTHTPRCDPWLPHVPGDEAPLFRAAAAGQAELPSLLCCSIWNKPDMWSLLWGSGCDAIEYETPFPVPGHSHWDTLWKCSGLLGPSKLPGQAREIPAPLPFAAKDAQVPKSRCLDIAHNVRLRAPSLAGRNPPWKQAMGHLCSSQLSAHSATAAT